MNGYAIIETDSTGSRVVATKPDIDSAEKLAARFAFAASNGTTYEVKPK